jgi:hypothetical protein
MHRFSFFPIEVIDVDPVDAEPRPAVGQSVWKVEDWFADDDDDAAAAAADDDPIDDPQARPSTPLTVPELRHLLRRFDVNNLASIVCKYCLEARPFMEVIVPCGHCMCSGCSNMMDNCPECPQRPPQRIIRTERIHAASMMVAWRDDQDLAGNFAAGVEANEPVDPMAGRRPADVTDEEYMERLNVEMAQELNRENGNDNDGN